VEDCHGMPGAAQRRDVASSSALVVSFDYRLVFPRLVSATCRKGRLIDGSRGERESVRRKAGALAPSLFPCSDRGTVGDATVASLPLSSLARVGTDLS
jgi:hypothetical protein